MTPETVNAWFTPFHYFVYLGVIVIMMAGFYMWRWADKCRNFVKVIVVKADGSTDTQYAPKTGSSVKLTNPNTGSTKLWPITQLSTIDMLYPGDGLIPMFLQKTIRTTIVDETDWEPMLNRGSYSVNVASPDVKIQLKEIANKLAETNRKPILDLIDNLRTASTREMIANPAVLGNFLEEKISEMVTAIGKDLFDPLQEALKKIGKPLNSVIVYIGLGLITVLVVYVVFMINSIGGLEDLSGLMKDIALIKQSLGVK